MDILYIALMLIMGNLLSIIFERKNYQQQLEDKLITLIPAYIIFFLVPLKLENLFKFNLRIICLICYYAFWMLTFAFLITFIFDHLETR